jgi:hypothetical protein
LRSEVNLLSFRKRIALLRSEFDTGFFVSLIRGPATLRNSRQFVVVLNEMNVNNRMYY